jgi:uncharacterized protein (DUF736 family)
MIIGSFQKTDDGFSGSIRTLSPSAEVAFQPSVGDKKDKSPDYRVSAGGMIIGAAWKEQSGAGNPYLSVHLDDPSFASSIRCALVKSGVEKSYNLVWERQRKRREGTGASANGEF